mmetsp:Transcript_4549/g.8531  ORF Transcript_4549/g.8531 Transcript_4549/m.8531 type:complete len:786 (+) Transcript_4549:231-2588(+)|eukprot:CAMPEP_0114259264 /NCGR_PEP_ID=MMETSP0058-20121206/19799_1 /TAXON_ID=36894 /ORGANISM="Pyramimonas parkeae, CCMP726" /LENGTH=785 /DNA_ID=CAMNT_0001374297 /DNA_START=113 /DNA_END=2470 /DNA_ORIENTATION=+
MAEGKKGNELTELKQQLRMLAASQSREDLATKRDLFKKIISYMSLSIDVSALFTEMTMATATADVATKKMLYHYITYHAHLHPDLSLLAINTLLKDGRDEDPTIRGLALRSLSSLRVPNLIEYLTDPLQRALDDPHPYVRRTAVMGVLKLYHMDDTVVEQLNLMSSLHHLALHDQDAQVAANCISVIAEVEGFQALATGAMVVPVLNRIKDFTEWGVCTVLEVVSHYTPAESSEVYDMMNVLEPCLSHANSAVVLATVRVFLRLTLCMPEVHQQVYERIKAPLLTLISSSVPEIAYTVVAHMHILVTRAPMLFAEDHKHFYCRFNDPTYIKVLKLEMLTAIADFHNVYEIATELSEYVADADAEISRKSIMAVGTIALELPDAEGIVARLLQFLELGQPHIVGETLVQMKDLLRRQPKHTADITAALAMIGPEAVEEPTAKAAFVWMVGELGTLDPYLLEPMVEAFGEEESPEVRLALISACAKLFFKRPPECQRLLGSVLEAGIADSNQDVHDRALCYYRLLQHSVHEARRVIVAEGSFLGCFAETRNTELLDRLFDEINTLSVLYRQPACTFTDARAAPPQQLAKAPSSGTPPAMSNNSAVVPTAEADLLGGEVREEDFASGAAAPAEEAYAAPAALVSLLDIGNDVGDGPAASASTHSDMQLSQNATLDAPTFQRKWGALTGSTQSVECARVAEAVSTQGTVSLKQWMATKRIQTMASGGSLPVFKFFFYAEPELKTGEHFLVEMVLNTTDSSAALTFKSDANPEQAKKFSNLVIDSLRSIQ